MNYNIFFLLFISFILIYWIQNSDNKNKNKNIFFNKIKLPVLVISLIGIVYLFNIEDKNNINFPIIQMNLPQNIYTEQPKF